MLIRKITIKNFQAHKNLSLDLAEFTAIVGPSSAGKSAILRALSWLFYGDWDATYPNDAEQETAIAIQLDNGTIWGRFRKGKRNWAMCRKPGEKPLTYQDFGELVPGLLEEFNVRPIKLGTGKVNLNFSMQDDPIFMVHESKPAKAQWIGRLYGAHILNQMLRLMAKDKRSIEADKKAAEDEEGRLRAELTKYVGLEEQAAELDRASDLIKELAELNDCQAQLTTILQDREAIKKGAHFLDADTDGLKIDLARLSDLRAAQDAVLSVKREEWTLGQNHYANVDTTQLRADLEQLADTMAKLVECRKVAAELETVTQERYKLTSLAEVLDPRIDLLRSDMKAALFTEGKCPLCQSKPKSLDMGEVQERLKELVG